MKFNKVSEIDEKVFDCIKMYLSENVYATEIFKILTTVDFNINVKNEEELTKDIYNESKTLTQYRAYTIGNNINIFNTRYETVESLTYVLFHEICHYMIRLNDLTFLLFEQLNALSLKEKGLVKDFKEQASSIPNFEQLTTEDDIHENLPEEQICNAFAEAIVGKNYNRLWWRENIRKVNEDNV